MEYEIKMLEKFAGIVRYQRNWLTFNMEILYLLIGLATIFALILIFDFLLS